MNMNNFTKNQKTGTDRNKTIEESSFVSNLNEIENKYVDSLLNGDLKQIYKGVQLKCKDFRNQMFAKNLVQLDKDYSYKSSTVPSSSLRNLKSQNEIILDEVIAE